MERKVIFIHLKFLSSCFSFYLKRHDSFPGGTYYLQEKTQCRILGIWKEEYCIYKCKLRTYTPGYMCMRAHSLSHVQLFAALWTVVCPAPLSMGFPRQEQWSWWPFPPPGDLPDLGNKRASLGLAGKLFTTEPPGKYICVCVYIYVCVCV